MPNQERRRAAGPATVAATFESEPDAERCVGALVEAGFERDHITLVTTDDEGTLAPVEPEVDVLRGTRLVDGGVAVVLDVPDARRALASRVLEESGGALVRSSP